MLFSPSSFGTAPSPQGRHCHDTRPPYWETWCHGPTKIAHKKLIQMCFVSLFPSTCCKEWEDPTIATPAPNPGQKNMQKTCETWFASHSMLPNFGTQSLCKGRFPKPFLKSLKWEDPTVPSYYYELFEALPPLNDKPRPSDSDMRVT